MEIEKLEKVLAIIGENVELRREFINWCKSVEKKLRVEGSIRDEITKFLVDAIYMNIPVEKKELKNGLIFEFCPNKHSKVAREFILSNPEIPEFIWEPQTTKLLLHLANHAKNVIIGGAYFGDQAILIANLIKKNEGIVHAFELNKMQSEFLKRNSDNNSLTNIKIINKGLWNNSITFLNLSDDDDLAFASSSEMSSNQKPNTITIDEYAKDNCVPYIDLIMLDIEGSEFKALQGAENLLRNTRENSPNIVFEVHRSYVDWSNGLENTDILKYLRSFNYNIFAIRDFQANFDMKEKLIELISPNDTYLEGPPHGFNMLATKDLRLIKNGKFKFLNGVSPKYLVHKNPIFHHHSDGFNN
jgi:FkbM family methyltransferase